MTQHLTTVCLVMRDGVTYVIVSPAGGYSFCQQCHWVSCQCGRSANAWRMHRWKLILSFAIAFRHGVLDFENKSLADSVSE